MAFTNGNDINILQGTDLSSVGAGAGNDRYVLDASILNPGQRITISDSQGLNTFQLSGGLVITSSLVANDAVQLTLNNGAVITVLGASSFNFQTGGNPINGTGGTTQNYSAFVTASLGVAGGVPAAGAAPAAGGTATVLANGGTTVGGGGIPGATYALVAGATSADEGTTATFELTTTNVVAGTEVAYTLSGIDAADLASGALTGKATVGANGKATISVALAADSKTEGAETLTVTAGGATASTTVNDTSVGLTYTLKASSTEVNEGDAATFTVTASKAVAVDTEVTFQLALGTAQLADFNAGAFNPAKIVIKAGQTSATQSITAITNDGTELTETYTVAATVGGASVGTVNMSILDGAVGAGQTFTLTTGLDLIPGMAGSNGNTVTAGNDIIVAVSAALPANSTLGATDQIDGGQGIDTLKVISDGTAPGLGGVSNVEIIEVSSSAGVTLNTSAIAGVTNLNVTKAAGAVSATAAATTDVSATVNTDAVTVQGGKNVVVNLAAANAGDNVVVGSTTAAAGTVAVNATSAAAVNGANFTMGTVNVTGGTTVNVIQKAGDASGLIVGGPATTHTQGNVTVTGAAATTAVNIKGDAAVAAATGTVAVAGATEVASVKFVAGAGAVTVGGVIFTPSKALTANEVAQAFANLSATAAKPGGATGDTQGSGIAGNGTFTGSLTAVAAFNSAVATGDTVVFTAAKAGTLADLVAGGATVTTTTQGVTAVAGAAAKLGVVAGSATVDGTASPALKTITVDGYSTGATTATTVLETLNLSNGGAFTAAASAATLALNLEKVTGAIAVTTAPTTLNVKSTGANTSALTAAATKSLNVSGTGVLNATGSSMASLETVAVTGTAGLNLGAALYLSLKSIDSTATTGAVTAAINGTLTTYTGGAGIDSVTLLTGTALTKDIDLGAGDDTLVFGVGVTGSTKALSGGAGTDTLSMTTVNADALDVAVQTFYTGFERLTISDAAASATVDLANLGFTNYVTTSGSTGTLTVNNLASNGTVVLTAAPTTGVTVGVKDALTGAADVLNVVLSSTGNLPAGLLTAANVETINISTVDTEVVVAPVVQTKNVDTLTLTADKASTVNVTGAADLTLTLTGSVKVTSIDGSAMTGGLTVTSLNATAATTIKGGAGNDVLTATGTTADVLMGGAGNDTLVSNAGLSVLTGGAGNDIFKIGVASLNVNSYSTIADFAAGDLLEITGASSFAASKVVLGGTAVFQDFANAITAGTAAGAVSWFQFGGDTYVVQDAVNTVASFNNGVDFVVKLTGLVDLSNASFNNFTDTIALV